MRVVRGPLCKVFAFGLLLACGLFSAPAWASKLAVVSRGIGPGSDKAAALTGYYAREALAAQDRFEVVNVTQALGNPDRDKAVRRFSVAEGLAQKARDAYARLDLDVADEALRQALAQYERYAGYVHDYKKVAEALMLLGAVRILRGDEHMGNSFLEQALNVMPDIEPDPRVFNPAMRIQFNQTATRLGARANGTLSLTSSPGSAAIWLDGHFVGVSPVVVENVTAGRHYLRVERDGYRPWGKVLTVKGNGETTDNALLRPAVHFEEFDALLDRAARSLDDGADGHSNALTELANLVGADEVFLTQVRLDGERVRVTAQHHEAGGKKRDKQAQHVFPYEPKPEVYAREVGVMLRTSFDLEQDGSPVASAPAEATGPGGAPAASPRRGREGDKASAALQERPASNHAYAKPIVGSALSTVGAALVVTGAVEWVVAKSKHDKWRKLAQVEAAQANVNGSSGRKQAIAGDVLMTTGLVVSLAGILTWSLWHPEVAVSDNVIEPASSSGHRGDGHQLHFRLGLEPTAHGATLLPTWTF